MTSLAKLVVEVQTTGTSKAKQNLDRLAAEAKQTENSLNRLRGSFVGAGRGAEQFAKKTKTAEEVARSSRGGFRAMRGATQQLSFQLQDVAVQAQSGTDSLRILAQQGPQIASIFGPGGAIFGAVLAFGALIASTLMTSIMGAEEEIDDLAEAMDELSQKTEEASGVFKGLAEEFNRFAKASEAVTIAMAASELRKIQQILDATGLRATQAFMEFAEAADLPVDSISTLSTSLKITEKAMDQFGLSFEELMGLSFSRTPAITAIQEQVRALEDQFGISQQAAFEFIKTLAGVYKQPTAEGINNLLEQTAQMSQQVSSADDNMLKFVKSLDQLAVAATNAERAQASFQRVAETGSVIDELAATRDFEEMEREHQQRLLEQDQAHADRIFKQRERNSVRAEAAKKRENERFEALEERRMNQLLAQDMRESEERKRIKEQASKMLSTLYSAQAPEVMAFARQQQAMLAILEEAHEQQIISQQVLDNAKLEMQTDLQEKIYESQLAAQLRQEQLRLRSLEAEMTLMERWYIATKQALDNVEILQVQLAQSFENNMGKAFEDMLTGASSFKDAFRDMTGAILKEFLGMVARMIAKRIAFAVIGGSMEAAGAGKLAAYQTALGQAKVTEAALNAFVATSAIPIVGPGLAPGAAAAAAAAAQALAGANTAANIAAAAVGSAPIGGRATGGQVRGGQTYLVGEQGPELLSMGTSGRISSNDQLKKAMGGGESIQVVNNIDARGADASVEMKIRAAVEQSSQATIATIQDLMRRRRFV